MFCAQNPDLYGKVVMGAKSVLSNVDLIRRFVFENRPVSMDQIVQELRSEMAAIQSDDMARDKYIMPVLKSQPYYQETNGKWSTIREEMPEFQAIREVMEKEHRLLYEREVRSKIASQLGVKMLTVVVDLNQAPELSKDGTRWGLKEWQIVNDDVAEILDQHPGGLSEKDLLKHVCERTKIDPVLAILDLKRDKNKRFVQSRKVWLLKEHFIAAKEEKNEKSKALPSLKGKGVELLLEGSFLDAQASKQEAGSKDAGKTNRTRLKKALKKQAQDILEHREDLTHRPEDLAAKLSQVLSAAGVDEYAVASFQRVEPAPKEKGLSAVEREDIQSFIDQLLEEETTGVGPSLQSVVNAPLSAKKMQDVLRLKYIGYSRDRAVIPPEYCRLLVETLKPTVNSSVLNPSCLEGNIAVELFSYLHEKLEGAAWTLAGEDSKIEVVQPDGARYILESDDEALMEVARDKFIVTHSDLLNHFINFRFAGIEPDGVLAKSARVICRLSGYDNVYIVNKDYLTELPQTFNQPASEDNDISQRFDLVVGNLTFTQDANIGANYLDQSLRLLKHDGICGVFVLEELLGLLKEHGLLGDFLYGRAVTHFIRLPLIEGRHKVVLLVVQAVDIAKEPPPIIVAEVSDFKSANVLSHHLQGRVPKEADDGKGVPYTTIEQLALMTLIQ